MTFLKVILFDFFSWLYLIVHTYRVYVYRMDGEEKSSDECGLAR